MRLGWQYSILYGERWEEAEVLEVQKVSERTLIYGFSFLVCLKCVTRGLGGRCVGEHDHCNPCFITHLNDWELKDIEVFFSRLQGNFVKREVKDRVVWLGSMKGVFPNNIFYSILKLEPATSFLVVIIWNCWAPPIACF